MIRRKFAFLGMDISSCVKAAVLVLLSVQYAACYHAHDDCTFLPNPINSSSTAGAVGIPGSLGVNISFTDPKPGEIQKIYDAGFRWVRMDLKWDLTERERGRYDFAAYDRLMSSLKPFGIRALFILDYSNPLYDGDKPPRTDEARGAFAQWAVAAAQHFANRGVLWETYNEPNHPLFWPPKPNANDYAALALAVGKAFRDQVPNEELIGPATSEIDFDFLEQCFKAGLLDYWSAVSIHPYRRSDPETAASDYCRLRGMIDKYAPIKNGAKKQIGIISGEWGYSDVWPGLNQDIQGRILARSLLTNLGNGVRLSIWYDWQDGTDPRETEHHFGIVSQKDFEPKPAYLAIQTLSKTLAGYQFQKRLAAGSPQDYLLVFTDGARQVLAAHTTAPSARQIVIPLPPGSYEVIQHTGERIRTVQVDSKGLSISLSTAPLYVRAIKG